MFKGALSSVLGVKVKALVGTFNKERALVGAFSGNWETSQKFADSSGTGKYSPGDRVAAAVAHHVGVVAIEHVAVVPVAEHAHAVVVVHVAPCNLQMYFGGGGNEETLYHKSNAKVIHQQMSDGKMGKIFDFGLLLLLLSKYLQIQCIAV